MKSLFNRADHISSEMFEEYRPIKGFEDYEISRDGVVRREFRNGYHYLSTFDNGFGYKFVVLCKYGKQYTRYVDRLVTSTFSPNDDLYQSEEFETIPGFEDYEISKNGIVRRWYEGGHHYISPYDNGKGYKLVALSRDGKVYQKLVHRLVAITFLPNDDPANKREINHINEIKSDNRLENLEWCDHVYNNNYGTKNERAIQTRRNKTNSQNAQNSDEKP